MSNTSRSIYAFKLGLMRSLKVFGNDIIIMLHMMSIRINSGMLLRYLQKIPLIPN